MPLSACTSKQLSLRPPNTLSHQQLQSIYHAYNASTGRQACIDAEQFTVDSAERVKNAVARADLRQGRPSWAQGEGLLQLLPGRQLLQCWPLRQRQPIRKWQNICALAPASVCLSTGEYASPARVIMCFILHISITVASHLHLLIALQR